MGVADAIPGISGGTVALILGHYQRLVTATSRIDSTLLRLAIERRFGEAARHVDLRFVAALGVGIAAGGGIMVVGAMHWLLENRMPEILAVLFGLVVASGWVLAGQIDRWNAARGFACVAGVGAAAALSSLPATTGSASLPFLFLAGAVAICAMILPGISGAFVLLLLGVYHLVSSSLKEFLEGALRWEFSFDVLSRIVVFAAGCLVGLLAFTRLLRWMLDHYRAATMAGLVGLMAGSLGRLWPLQRPTAETAALELKLREFEFVAPTRWTGDLWTLVLLAIVAAVAVLVLDRLGRRVAE